MMGRTIIACLQVFRSFHFRGVWMILSNLMVNLPCLPQGGSIAYLLHAKQSAVHLPLFHRQIFSRAFTLSHRLEQQRQSFMVFSVGRILVLNISVWTTIYCVIQQEFRHENTSGNRLVSCCSAYSIIKCCYCETK